MGRPEDIPAEVWADAWRAFDHEPDASVGSVVEYRVEKVARALLAERLKERERCLAVANGWLISFGESGAALEHTTPQQWANDAVADIADAINSGSRP